MDHNIVFIVYGGRWDANNKYVDHQVKIIMVQEGISYMSLIWKIYKELGLDPTINSIKMSFDPKIETSRGMTIENDENVAVFLYLIKNDPEFKRCPLVVEIEEYSQSTTKSKTTNNQASSNEKERDNSVVSEESGMCGKSTSCSSMGGTANTMTSSATTFGRINSDSSKANQFSFGCQPKGSPVFGFKS